MDTGKVLTVGVFVIYDKKKLLMTRIAFYFILSSEINVYQKWIKVIFSLQN